VIPAGWSSAHRPFGAFIHRDFYVFFCSLSFPLFFHSLLLLLFFPSSSFFFLAVCGIGRFDVDFRI